MMTLFDILHTTQTRLFPWLEERLDPLSAKEQRGMGELVSERQSWGKSHTGEWSVKGHHQRFAIGSLF
ncbi:MAG: hypothetical protein CVU51_01600 [Deltaproteobacteria bacterium HGW-Deltaproteobacteria-1]|jgi:hypothetical protein|nr:MAG: hypothetical protein CVU51_01600 [Deltaproteobacteria bacterium HGW-Deltaproteobacteria-1]